MAIIEVKKSWIGTTNFGEALRQARQGDTILLVPGSYNVGSINLAHHGLTIQAKEPQTVTLSGTFSVTGIVNFCNLSIDGGGSNVVVVRDGGRVQLLNCTLSNAGKDMPTIVVKNAFSEITRCNIHAASSNGVWVSENGQAEIIQCELWGCGKSAIHAHQSTVRVKRSVIRDSAGNGLLAEMKTDIEIEKCVIKG